MWGGGKGGLGVFGVCLWGNGGGEEQTIQTGSRENAWKVISQLRYKLSLCLGIYDNITGQLNMIIL